ncbi:MAG: hypothetical protein AAF499_15005 [Pseudomonadota bacterium]
MRYPDGPRDAEAVAIDPISETVLLLSKRDRPNRLYALPLAAFDEPATTHQFNALGTVAVDALPSPIALLRQPELLAIATYSTGFDISADGARATVLGYRRARTVTRRADESWTSALNRLQPTNDHGLRQAEAIAFSRSGHELTITSEGLHAPLVTQTWPAARP